MLHLSVSTSIPEVGCHVDDLRSVVVPSIDYHRTPENTVISIPGPTHRFSAIRTDTRLSNKIKTVTNPVEVQVGHT